MTVLNGDRLRITTVLSISAEAQIMNVFDYLCTDSAEGTDQQVMDDFEDHFSTMFAAVAGLFSDEVEAVELRGFNLTRDTPMPVTAWTGFAGGSVVGQKAPYGVAGLILFRTSRSRVLGRKFIGGVAQASLDNSLWNSTHIATLAAFGAGMLGVVTGGASGGTFNFRIYDKLGVPWAPTAVLVRAVPAYQRRRKQGVGV